MERKLLKLERESLILEMEHQMLEMELVELAELVVAEHVELVHTVEIVAHHLLQV